LTSEIEASMNTDVAPCDDFYQYACGGWLASTELPADKARISRSFTAIADRNEKVLHDLLEAAATSPSDDPVRGRLGQYYGACMDTDAIDALGVAPVQPMLDAIQQVEDMPALMHLVSDLHFAGVGGLWSEGVLPDAKSPDVNVFALYQGGLGLPDRAYYLDTSERMVEIRAGYLAHLARMHTLLGDDDAAAKAKADTIMTFETRIAELHWERVMLRDPVKTYNPMSLEALAELTPGMPWPAFFEPIEMPAFDTVVVGTPSYFEGLAPLLAETDLATIKVYLAWHVVDTFAGHLATDIDAAQFDFFGKTLSGQQEQQARWKRCVARTDDALGDLLGQAYVDVAFAGSSKSEAVEMIGRVERALEDRMGELDWMDDTTRERARDKARAVTNKVGYPDKWEAYEGLEVSGASHLANYVAAMEHLSARLLAEVGQPVDTSRWYMTPPTVNAYYNPMGNEIVFPAGILQPPFFDAYYPKSFNYGAIGMVMGHEFTHGFDDSGRQFAADGQLTDWWEPSVVEAFEERAACVRDQYDAMEIEPGLNVNGQLTLGENIADLGGIQAAYEAYMTWSEEYGAEAEIVGLQPEQQFFVAYAQGWCSLRSDEVARQLAATDSHSPPDFRVNGPLQNTPAFAEAFACEAGDPMVREDICVVW
jgi:endothelin-converting enzyme/putative endopeptidase